MTYNGGRRGRGWRGEEARTGDEDGRTEEGNLEREKCEKGQIWIHVWTRKTTKMIDE